MTLRKAVAISTVALFSISLLASVAFLVFTALRRADTRELMRNQQQASLAGELLDHSVSHSLQTSPDARAMSEVRGRAILARARDIAREPDEKERINDLAPVLEKYWASPDRAMVSRDVLVRVSDVKAILDQKTRAHFERAERFDGVSNAVGIACVMMLGFGILFLTWQTRAGLVAVPAPEVILAPRSESRAEPVRHASTDELRNVAEVINDLQGPLANARLAASNISIDKPLPSEGRVRDLFAAMDRELKRMSALVEDAINATNNTDALVLRKRACDVQKISKQVLQHFQAMAPAHRFTLAASGPMWIVADPLRIEQAMHNLLSNAVRYSPSATEITLKLHSRENDLVVSVEDRGVGMPSDMLYDFLGPLPRPSNGLGLYVARRIAEAHGGRLEIASTPGEGSIVGFAIPRHQRNVEI